MHVSGSNADPSGFIQLRDSQKWIQPATLTQHLKVVK